jgi:hypothetical protein
MINLEEVEVTGIGVVTDGAMAQREGTKRKRFAMTILRTICQLSFL